MHLFRIPRCYVTSLPVERKELHIFVDASEHAFGAVIYLRTLYDNGDVSCVMVMSKSRLAPLKTLTIPRLELQAAVLGIRVKNTIMNEIDTDIDRITFWSDTMLTLQYINNETKRFRVFVSNRVAEIRKYSDVSQWRHVPGNENPADDIT